MRRLVFALAFAPLVACSGGVPDDAPTPNATAIPTGAAGATGVFLGPSPVGPAVHGAAPPPGGEDEPEWVPPGSPPPPDPFAPGIPPTAPAAPHKKKKPKGTNL